MLVGELLSLSAFEGEKTQQKTKKQKQEILLDWENGDSFVKQAATWDTRLCKPLKVARRSESDAVLVANHQALSLFGPEQDSHYLLWVGMCITKTNGKRVRGRMQNVRKNMLIHTHTHTSNSHLTRLGWISSNHWFFFPSLLLSRPLHAYRAPESVAVLRQSQNKRRFSQRLKYQHSSARKLKHLPQLFARHP